MFAAVNFGVVRHHLFSGGKERVKYRCLRFCAELQFGIVGLPCHAELPTDDGMDGDLSA